VIEGRAAVADGRGGVRIAPIVVAAPKRGEVLVRIAASGVCHTDHDFMRNAAAPLVLGHEGAGVVEAVGDGVDGVAPGDAVLLTWAIGCGRCHMCAVGLPVHCERLGLHSGGAHHGSTVHDGAPIPRAFQLGTLSTHAVVRAEAVVPMSPPIPFTSACILGCGVMTGVGSVLNAARVEAGASVVVIGCGGVGLNVIQGARIAGAAVIVAVDVAEARLDTARRFGATHTVRATRGDDEMRDVVAAVRGIAGARGADYAFECTAVPALGAAPLRMIRHGGTAVQVSGIEQVIPVDMELFEFDKTYVNPLYGNCRPSVDFPRLLELHRRGDLLLDELVTRTYALDDLDAAFDDLLAGRNAKGVIVLSDVA
jgi:S-(hydroxymethyl)glutathione dehydrogenase / alcohol dehydrogenase